MNDWIELYTDGACKGNPGPGGWGVLIQTTKAKQELCGGAAHTTNNRMELTAVIKGLESLTHIGKVRIITDSQYVKNGMTKWIEGWRHNGWRTASKEPVKNQDLWEQLDTLLSRQQAVEWQWVRGHTGHPGNECADKLANQGVKGISKGHATPETTLKQANQNNLTPQPPLIPKTPTTTKKNSPAPKPHAHNEMKVRQIVLDTETTGLSSEQGHRIIEIGAIELIERRITKNDFHQYLQPDRDIDAGATKVHGIVSSFLADKPRFADIAANLITYLQGAELIIHNAPFDTAFLNAEFARVAAQQGIAAIRVNEICTITDTVAMARKMYPGQRNNLDALCKRYNIDQSHRTLHGALLDARLLASVYLAMTGGQVSLSLDANDTNIEKKRQIAKSRQPRKSGANRSPLNVIRATDIEEELHQARLEQINQKSDGQCVWLRTTSY